MDLASVIRWMTCAGILGLSTARAEPMEHLVVPDVALSGTDGRAHPLRSALSEKKLTVFTFFSADCPCMRSHVPVLLALAKEFGARGVQFFLVDPEAGATLKADAAESARRKIPFPILMDPAGALSRAMEAQYATHTVVVDAQGRVHFRGGIDSSKREPGPDAQPYLRKALERLLEGNEPNPAEPKSLGCYLRQK